MTTRVTVVGAGLIGASWALLFRQAGHRTTVVDIDERALRRGRQILLDAATPSGSDAPTLAETIRWTTRLEEAVADAEYVQECVPEDLSLKRSIFAQLDEVTPRTATLASSAALHPISDIAGDLAGAERCLVVHPTNPPHLLRFCEVVPSPDTAQVIVDRTMKLMTQIGQHPVLCAREVPGFVLNRLQFALVREAFHLLRSGVTDVAGIDAALTEGLGPRWAFLGPFAVEEVNGSSIGESLRHGRLIFDQLMSLSAAPYAPLTDEDIERAEVGLHEALRPASRADLLRRRDQGILTVRNAKSAGQHSYG